MTYEDNAAEHQQRHFEWLNRRTADGRRNNNVLLERLVGNQPVKRGCFVVHHKCVTHDGDQQVAYLTADKLTDFPASDEICRMVATAVQTYDPTSQIVVVFMEPDGVAVYKTHAVFEDNGEAVFLPPEVLGHPWHYAAYDGKHQLN